MEMYRGEKGGRKWGQVMGEGEITKVHDTYPRKYHMKSIILYNEYTPINVITREICHY